MLIGIITNIHIQGDNTCFLEIAICNETKFHYELYKKPCLYSTSDDNLLKNIELFDKMSLRFGRRVLFIKDVIGSSEICCWTFYGHGRKVAEVCCHSIVYATDKKHTKVMLSVCIHCTYL